MRHTLNPLANLLCTLVEIGREGGYPKDRWILLNKMVAAGIPRKRAEEAIAQAFPFPHTPEESYAAGVIWGTNYGVEGPEYRDYDEDGNPLPVRWKMRVVRDPKWIERFVAPLRIKPEYMNLKQINFSGRISLKLDGMLKYNLSRLGVGGLHIDWDLVPREFRAQFIAGVIDSTEIILAGKFNKTFEEFNRYINDQEFVLDTDDSALAMALRGGIEGAELCDSYFCADHLLRDINGASCGIRITGKSIQWFFENVHHWLYYSNLREEKKNESDFDSPNKNKLNTGNRLKKLEKDKLKKWAEAANRRRIHVSSVMLCEKSEILIGRSISTVTAWKILSDLKLVVTRGNKQRKY